MTQKCDFVLCEHLGQTLQEKARKTVIQSAPTPLFPHSPFLSTYTDIDATCMINAPKPSTSVYAQREPSKTRWLKGLGPRLQDTHTRISTAAGVWQSSLRSHHLTPLSYSWPSHAPSSGTLSHAHTDAAYKQDNAFQSWNQTKGRTVACNFWYVAVSQSHYSICVFQLCNHVL